MPTAPPAPTRAACAGHSRPLWDERVEGETEVSRTHRLAQAVQICAGCPIRAECADRRGPGDYGVYGGQLFTPGPRPARTPTTHTYLAPLDGHCQVCRAPVGGPRRRYCEAHAPTRQQLEAHP